MRRVVTKTIRNETVVCDRCGCEFADVDKVKDLDLIPGVIGKYITIGTDEAGKMAFSLSNTNLAKVNKIDLCHHCFGVFHRFFKPELD